MASASSRDENLHLPPRSGPAAGGTLWTAIRGQARTLALLTAGLLVAGVWAGLVGLGLALLASLLGPLVVLLLIAVLTLGLIAGLSNADAGEREPQPRPVVTSTGKPHLHLVRG